MPLIDGLRYLRGVSRGLRRGDLWSPASRWAPQPSPDGSEQPFPRMRGPMSRVAMESWWFTETHHTVRVAGLDAPLRILHLTDPHVRGAGPWLERMCKRIREVEADLIAITGDVVAREWTPVAVHRWLSQVPRARLGTFAVMGNWEYWAGFDPDTWRSWLEPHKIHLLDNAQVDLGPLTVVGTDDLCAGTPNVSRALDGLDPDRPAVVLSHSPAIFPELDQCGVDLVLSGHSHGGQVHLPLIGAPFVPKGTGPYVTGWFQGEYARLFVSHGLGWSIAPVRLYRPPEIAVIHLVPEGGP